MSLSHTRTELLAPAGSLTALKASVNAGADAVYIGGSRFGARAYADNPGEDDLITGIDYAHLRGARVYMTVNTLLKESELDDLEAYMRPYVEEGIDAVLVQDFGVLRRLHELFPALPLHASTQMTVTGPKGAALLRPYGVTRVVPARELSIEELKAIREESGLEVETFVHGALCYCYSGECLLSSMIGGRSGNRGRCAQPCRLLNLLDDREHFDGRSSILDRKDARHHLSPKDLCAIELLPELIRAGIDSLKIEGRMKQPEYAAGVVSIYRAALDRALDDFENGTDRFHVSKQEKQMLYDLYNRSGFTTGYFHTHGGPEMMALVKHELTADETQARHSLYEQMKENYIDKPLKIPADAEFTFTALSPMKASLLAGGIKVELEGAEAEAAQKRPLSESRIRENLMKTGETDFFFRELHVRTDGNCFVPLSVLNDFRRTALEKLRAEMLKPFKRETSSEKSPIKAQEDSGTENTARSGSSLKISALVSDRNQLTSALASKEADLIYAEAAFLYRSGDPVDQALAFIRECREHGKEPGIAMPRIDREGSSAGELKEAAGELISEGLAVFLVRALETMADLAGRGFASYIRADASLYTFNHEAAAFLKEQGIKADTAPVELNKKELFRRDNRASEIIAYGHLPLMLSAQCLVKNTARCTKKNEIHTLTDRTGTKFTVRCECVFCYNVIYNYLPLSLLQDGGDLIRMGFSGLRLEFTTESAGEVTDVLRAAAACREGRQASPGQRPATDRESTRGHFHRGVE